MRDHLSSKFKMPNISRYLQNIILSQALQYLNVLSLKDYQILKQCIKMLKSEVGGANDIHIQITPIKFPTYIQNKSVASNLHGGNTSNFV